MLVEVSGITVKSVAADVLVVVFDTPKSINSLDGEVPEELLSRLVLPAYSYESVTVKVNAIEDGIIDSFLESVNETDIELTTGSC